MDGHQKNELHSNGFIRTDLFHCSLTCHSCVLYIITTTPISSQASESDRLLLCFKHDATFPTLSIWDWHHSCLLHMIIIFPSLAEHLTVTSHQCFKHDAPFPFSVQHLRLYHSYVLPMMPHSHLQLSIWEWHITPVFYTWSWHSHF